MIRSRYFPLFTLSNLYIIAKDKEVNITDIKIQNNKNGNPIIIGDVRLKNIGPTPKQRMGTSINM